MTDEEGKRGSKVSMPDRKPPKSKRQRRIRDARGRSVKPLDPVAMYLLRQHDRIEADVLQAIAQEKGVRITAKERASLIVGVVALLAVATLFVHSLIVGAYGGAPFARTSSLVWFSILPWAFWMRMKWIRHGKVAAAMLEYLRCPHCGYDLRLLPTDPRDGATLCPECGCAWELGGSRTIGSHGAAPADGSSASHPRDTL